jgi:archaellum biogenesis ATPase FlaH
METLANIVCPKDVSKFVGNKQLILQLSKSLQQANSVKNTICIYGPDGCGKTVLCKLLFEKYNFQVLEIGKDVLTIDNVKTAIENFAQNMTIEHYMFKKRKIVFVDDLDVLLSIDRNLVSKLMSLNKALKQKGIHIVITCNINTDKKTLNENEVDVFKMTYPTSKDAFAYIMTCLDTHHVEYNMEKLLLVSNKCKGNIREIVLNLSCSDNELKERNLEKTFKDANTFEISKYILSKSHNNEELEHFMRGDVGNVPYIMYENLPLELEGNYKIDAKDKASNKGIIDLYLQVNDSFINASTFEDQAYRTMDWSFVQYSNLIRMMSFQCVLQSTQRKATYKDLKYKASQMRSKSSHKKILGKKIKDAAYMANASGTALIAVADGKDNANSNITSLTSTYQKYFGS